MILNHYKYVIIGGGISGLGAYYSLKRKYGIQNVILLEKEDRVGGLCRSFKIKDFRFDNAVHFSFAAGISKKIFEMTPVLRHPSLAFNYSDGYWTKHPLQNNSFGLPECEKNKIIDSIVNRNINKPIDNYYDWLVNKFGKYFAEKYPCRYTRKYWILDAHKMCIDWVGNRLYTPSVEEVIEGSKTNKTPNTYYTNFMNYPKKGGFESFLNPLIEDSTFNTKCEVNEINLEEKYVCVNGQIIHYDNLISSIPLPKLVSITKNIPDNILSASKKLKCSSVALASIGFNKVIPLKSLWMYVYDEDIPFARIYSPSLKSPDNAPVGKSSIQCEIYYLGKLKYNSADLKDKIISSLIKMGICKETDIELFEIRQLKYANVIYDLNMIKNRDIVSKYFSDKNVRLIGRFGQWKYLWSYQALETGLNID